MSNLTVASLSAPSSSGNRISVPSPNVLYAPGHVIQVVNGTYNTQESYTTTSFLPSSFARSITPTSVSSRVLVTGSINIYHVANAYNVITVYRNNSVNLGSASWGFGVIYGSSGDRFGQVSFSFLDSPASTSSVTYTIYRRVTTGTGYINLNTETSTMTLMEIAA
jgi:hypothetical protein